MIEPSDRTLKLNTNFDILICFFFSFHMSRIMFAQAKDISISWNNLNYCMFGLKNPTKLKNFKQVVTLDFLQCGIGSYKITILVALFPHISFPTMALGLLCK